LVAIVLAFVIIIIIIALNTLLLWKWTTMSSK